MCTIFGYFSPEAAPETVKQALAPTTSRGPDAMKIQKVEGGIVGFQRLSIMGLTHSGMQPFSYQGNWIVCNGEIYGFRSIKRRLEENGIRFESDSDCEILLPLYEELGCDMFKELDAEFACILVDTKHHHVIAARDPIGIRPLYYGYDQHGDIVFASEPKNLVALVQKIFPFPPGHYYKDGHFVCYRDLSQVDTIRHASLEDTCAQLREYLMDGIQKRLDADAPIGFLLSGGLDSSLVCAISSKLLNKPIRTFAIGMKSDAIDLKYAKEVADYIHSEHHEFLIEDQDVLKAIDPVIQVLATYDITTIRASIGMYLLCQKIHEQTDVRVLLTGEISDEIFGYKYTDFAPDAQAFQKESEKRIRELHMYDVLRADRCISSNSMEARVPFGDLAFVDYCMHIDPSQKLNTYHKGKYLLRHAFEKDDILPHDILMREKAAFSDAVGHSLRDTICAYADSLYTDEEFETKRKLYLHAAPFTKESLLYREIFEKYYPGQSQMIIDFWMPNRTWKGCDVQDPSARVLSNYGQSGE